MSVIIKDMKKPSNCIWTEECVGYKCPLLNDEDCCNLQDCKEEWTWADQYAGCPLVELPEHHGRLIDIDEMKLNLTMGDDCNTCDEDWKNCQYNREYSKMDFCGWIDDQPIVVDKE